MVSSRCPRDGAGLVPRTGAMPCLPTSAISHTGRRSAEGASERLRDLASQTGEPEAETVGDAAGTHPEYLGLLRLAVRPERLLE